MAVLDDIINSGMIGDSLDLNAKYAGERARMRAGEQRIADAKSNLRDMRLPEFMRPELSSAGKLMAADMQTDRTAQARDDIQRAFQGTLAASQGNTRRRGLAQKLRAMGGALGDLFQKGEAARRASAQAVSPEMQAVGKEERALDRERKMFDFRKDRQIEALDDQGTRLKGAYGETQGNIQADMLKMIRENPELANIFKRGTSLGDEGNKPEKRSKTDRKIARSIDRMKLDESKIQDIEQDDEVFDDDLDFSSLLKNSKKQPGQFKNIFEYIKQLRG